MNRKDLDNLMNDKSEEHQVMIRLLDELIENNALIMSRLTDIETSMAISETTLNAHIVSSKLDMAHVLSGFPATDPETHRRYHETQIAMLEEKRKLRVAIQEKTISGLVWSTIIFIGIAVWNTVKTNIK